MFIYTGGLSLYKITAFICKGRNNFLPNAYGRQHINEKERAERVG
jgi:hypothetical protein